MKEIWKDIKDYEGLYQVSNLGRVKSLSRIAKLRNVVRKVPERLLKPTIGGRGYLYVGLGKEGKTNRIAVHILVAKTFIENTLNLPFINHKDEDKTNNCVDNLEWCTPKYNINYGTRNKRQARTMSKKVYQYSLKGELIKVWDSIKETKKHGYNSGNIASCCTGKRKTCDGYIWKHGEM